jgi:hypothetical protein
VKILKFIVFKVEDIEKSCNEKQLRDLYVIAHTIKELRTKEGRNPDPDYFVVNKDEPYADKVKALIEEHEGEEITFD